MRERLSLFASFLAPLGRFSLLALALAGGAAHALADSWEPRASMQTPRKYMSACAYPGGSEILVMGGFNSAGTGVLATARKYDANADEWTALASMNRARARPSVALAGANIYALGGYDASGQQVAEVESYNVAADTWTIVSYMPTPRSGMGCAAINGIIYTIGGKSGTAYTDVVEIFNPANGNWSTGAPMPTARAQMGAAAVGTKIYAVYGAVAPRTATNVIEVYDTVTDSWSTLAVGSPPTPLMRLVAVGSTHYLGNYVMSSAGRRAVFRRMKALP